ncbi:hypothetical protein HPP92_025752 [Vanilla planifolia]|uniref:Uncharacterized protein n=1 Tax=Vanilla planifolia TaxID=51239 RepID=A0A835PI39_VANPL|nr:hypothetical protein HPP92_025752 [Vanilla planifolia]
MEGGVNTDVIEEGGSGGGDQILRLLEECFSYIIALTSPRDACRSEAVSIAFRSAAVSNLVWRCFLPHDILEILARAISRIEFSSIKHLYFQLCKPILIDGGKKSFWLDRETGSKCYMLSARELVISGGDLPHSWDAHPESSFPEVAELLNVRWLDIHGKINTSVLSPRTQYASYLIYKTAPAGRCCILPPIPSRMWREFLGLGAGEVDARVPRRRAVAWPSEREDGWEEEALGEFCTEDGGAGEIDLCFSAREKGWRINVTVQGIEIRPAK